MMMNFKLPALLLFSVQVQESRALLPSPDISGQSFLQKSQTAIDNWRKQVADEKRALRERELRMTPEEKDNKEREARSRAEFHQVSEAVELKTTRTWFSTSEQKIPEKVSVLTIYSDRNTWTAYNSGGNEVARGSESGFLATNWSVPFDINQPVPAELKGVEARLVDPKGNLLGDIICEKSDDEYWKMRSWRIIWDKHQLFATMKFVSGSLFRGKDGSGFEFVRRRFKDPRGVCKNHQGQMNHFGKMILDNNFIVKKIDFIDDGEKNFDIPIDIGMKLVFWDGSEVKDSQLAIDESNYHVDEQHYFKFCETAETLKAAKERADKEEAEKQLLEKSAAAGEERAEEEEA